MTHRCACTLVYTLGLTIGLTLPAVALPQEPARSAAGMHAGKGATEEEVGFDTRTTSEAMGDLLIEAHRLCPVLAHAEVERSWAGLRPGSIDSRPYLGIAPGFENLIVATGHKILVIAFQVLKTNTPYVELGSDYFDRLNPARTVRKLVQRLEALGLQVQLLPIVGSNA